VNNRAYATMYRMSAIATNSIAPISCNCFISKDSNVWPRDNYKADYAVLKERKPLPRSLSSVGNDPILKFGFPD